MRLVLLVCLCASLLMPAGAAAKVTCDTGGPRAPSIDLRGLPRSPVVGRTYSLRLVTHARALNDRPVLMTMHCGAGNPVANTSPANGSFRRLGDPAGGVFTLSVRFPRAGPWAVSVMDLDGSFFDLGRRKVRAEAAAPPAVTHPDPSAPGANGLSGWVWPAAVAALAAGAGLALAVRRTAVG
jgi:hypothetical protein